jgi:hypothetical protein
VFAIGTAAPSPPPVAPPRPPGHVLLERRWPVTQATQPGLGPGGWVGGREGGTGRRRHPVTPPVVAAVAFGLGLPAAAAAAAAAGRERRPLRSDAGRCWPAGGCGGPALTPASVAAQVILTGTGQILVKYWSNTGQILVGSGKAPLTRLSRQCLRRGRRLLVKYWSNSGQIVVE